MRKIKIFQFLLFILIIICVYFHNKRYKSYELQALINYDISIGDWESRDMYFISQIDDFYPSLNVYAMPLKGIKGKYLVEIDSMELGVKYLKESRKDNPYLMFSELALAQYYYSQADAEKYKEYTYKLIKNLPNNPVHFVHYTRIMKSENKVDSIMNHFKKIRQKLGFRDEQIWKIALSSLVLDTTLIKKYNGKELAIIAAKEFTTFPEVLLLADYVLYSKEKVDLANDKHSQAIEIFDGGETEKAFKLFKEAIDLHPNNPRYFNNFVRAGYILSKFEEINNSYTQISDIIKNIKPETLYYIASSLYYEKEYDSACEILNSLDSNNLFVFDKARFPKCY
jgi:tetratricopeptide (TPR) repeat protein